MLYLIRRKIVRYQASQGAMYLLETLIHLNFHRDAISFSVIGIDNSGTALLYWVRLTHIKLDL